MTKHLPGLIGVMQRVRSAVPPLPPAASDLLVSGLVIAGDQRGRELGFPTANLSMAAAAVTDGVFAGWITAEAFGRRGCAVSVGTRSTFYGVTGERLLEAHILDFSGDIYGQEVTVHLVKKLRGQRKFPTLDALTAQLQDDVERTRRWMGEQARLPASPTDAWVPQGAW